jgi:glycolate oxidase
LAQADRAITISLVFRDGGPSNDDGHRRTDSVEVRVSNLIMPEPDSGILARRREIAAHLRTLVAAEAVIDDTNEMRAYESDGLTAYNQIPMLVVLPSTTGEVSQILNYCQHEGIKVVPRGAGTSLSGGALPLADGILLGMAKFNAVLDIDYDNRCATVQPGVTNLAISQAVEDRDFYYAPDPSSQIACTIGGNVAENSGGVHCLKYGLTTNNILGLEVVLIGGEVVRIGGKHLDAEGYDLMGLMIGSEGLLGVVTEVTVRILRKPETARALLIGFSSSEEAGACVASVISAGIIPGGMEMMDRLAIHAAEEFVHAGYPLDVEALLIVELDGPEAEVDDLIGRVSAIAESHGARGVKVSGSEDERLSFWAGRKAAFPAVGRISPDYYCMDGTIPRHRLPEVLARMNVLSKQYGLRVANVFHAGDGNLHPLILYDANVPGELERTEEFGAEILKLCVEVGGVLTGEHGVGVEKRDLMGAMFTEADLDQQQRVKCAFDPDGLLNPGKVFPVLHRCAELGRMHIHQGRVPFPDIPRF